MLLEAFPKPIPKGIPLFSMGFGELEFKGPAERVAGMSLGFRIISERELGGTEPLPTTPWYNPPLAPWGGYCLRPSHCRGSYGPVFSRETQMRERASSIWALGSKLCCPISHHGSVT